MLHTSHVLEGVQFKKQRNLKETKICTFLHKLRRLINITMKKTFYSLCTALIFYAILVDGQSAEGKYFVIFMIHIWSASSSLLSIKICIGNITLMTLITPNRLSEETLNHYNYYDKINSLVN